MRMRVRKLNVAANISLWRRKDTYDATCDASLLTVPFSLEMSPTIWRRLMLHCRLPIWRVSSGAVGDCPRESRVRVLKKGKTYQPAQRERMRLRGKRIG